MSAAEVIHRASRTARHPFERARMGLGIYARLPRELHDWSGPRAFYFDDESARRPLTPSVREHAERLLRGERLVLGLGWLKVPRAPWHLEPSRDVEWPRIDAARVLRAVDGLDARMTWELNRGHEWVVLARAWRATGDARFRTQLSAELASWREQNPLGVGINWASAMEAAIRIHSLAWVSAFLRGEPLRDIAAMIQAHAVFVRRNLSRHSSANNHLLVELSALAVAERVLWARADIDALDELGAELRLQTHADGVNAEMATHYHEFVLEAVRLVAELERVHGAPRVDLDEIAQSMEAYVDALTYADGRVLHQGDNDEGKVISLLQIEPGWLPRIDRRAAQSALFRVSGQVVLRSDRVVASFDAGPFGFGSLAAHGHCDCLAVNVAVDGEPVLVDRGTYRYNGERETREYFRSTAVHNTLQVANREQARSGGPFLWTQVPPVRIVDCRLSDEYDIAIAEHIGFAPITHRRRVVRHGDVLVVRDEVDNPADVSIRYHLAPAVHVGNAGAFAVMKLYGSGSVQIVEARHSDTYGLSTVAQTIEVRAHLTPGDYVVAVLAPSSADTGGLLSELGDSEQLATFELVRSNATAPTPSNTQNSIDI